MKLLKLAILGSLPFASLLTSNSVEADTQSLPTIEVYGFIWDAPIFLGFDANPYPDYTFDWGSNGSNGNVGNYTGPMPETCSLLAAGGRPDGCTQHLANNAFNPNNPNRPALPQINQ